MAVSHSVHVIVVGVLHQAAIEVGPREIVNCVLFVLHGAGGDLSIQVVVKVVV